MARPSAGEEQEFLYLTTRGRKTGHAREIEIWFTRRGRSHYVVAEHGLRAHWVQNLLVEPRENGEVVAKTAFIVYRSHHETDQQIFAGSREDLLRPVDGDWKIARRTILLDANVLLDKNLSIFL